MEEQIPKTGFKDEAKNNLEEGKKMKLKKKKKVKKKKIKKEEPNSEPKGEKKKESENALKGSNLGSELSPEIADNSSEDEGIEDYKVGGYHAVHVGEIFLNRYIIIQKLGWGHFSTVWLSRDVKYNTYVALKIQKSASHYLEAAYDEVEILEQVSCYWKKQKWQKSANNYLGGVDITRDSCYSVQLLNSFLHYGPNGKHFVMVFEIMGVNLLEIIKKYEYKGIPMVLVRAIAKQILIGLDYLHRICNIIHTDLKPENVLLSLTQAEIEQIVKEGCLGQKDSYKYPVNVSGLSHIFLPSYNTSKRKKTKEKTSDVNQERSGKFDTFKEAVTHENLNQVPPKEGKKEKTKELILEKGNEELKNKEYSESIEDGMVSTEATQSEIKLPNVNLYDNTGRRLTSKEIKKKQNKLLKKKRQKKKKKEKKRLEKMNKTPESMNLNEENDVEENERERERKKMVELELERVKKEEEEEKQKQKEAEIKIEKELKLQLELENKRKEKEEKEKEKEVEKDKEKERERELEEKEEKLKEENKEEILKASDIDSIECEESKESKEKSLEDSKEEEEDKGKERKEEGEEERAEIKINNFMEIKDCPEKEGLVEEKKEGEKHGGDSFNVFEEDDGELDEENEEDLILLKDLKRIQNNLRDDLTKPRSRSLPNQVYNPPIGYEYQYNTQEFSSQIKEYVKSKDFLFHTIANPQQTPQNHLSPNQFGIKKKKRFTHVDQDLKVKIVDLGNACWTYHHFTSQIQTRQYRSPEVIIGASYGASADIWSFACMIFELITGDFLFEPRKGHTFSKDDDHLAQMMELLNRMPMNFALSGKHSKKFFNKRGCLRRIQGLHFWPLKKVLMEKYHIKEIEAQALTDFLMPMLEWSPEKRATAKDMLNHPWLNMEDNWDIKMTEKEINKLNLKNKINKLNLDSSDRSSSMSNEEMNELCESENELNNADIEDNSNDYETMSECSFTEEKEGKGEKGKQGSENDAMTNEQLAACDPVAFKYSLHSKLLNIDHGPNPQFQ